LLSTLYGFGRGFLNQWNRKYLCLLLEISANTDLPPPPYLFLRMLWLRIDLRVHNGVSVGLSHIVSQGNVTATIIWFAITTGATAEPSYYKENE
jgi:hypothetical protein